MAPSDTAHQVSLKRSPPVRAAGGSIQSIASTAHHCVGAASVDLRGPSRLSPHRHVWLRVEGSRILMSNPEHRTRNKLHPYTAMVEVDVRLAGAKTTHSFFCH